MEGNPGSLTHRAQGAMAEVRAEQYLISLGWTVLARNFSAYGAEIDLIASDGRCVVFVEVKMRNRSRVMGRETVTLAKQRRICRGAMLFLQKKGLADRQARFDVIEIQDGHLTHIRDAFPYQGRAF